MIKHTNIQTIDLGLCSVMFYITDIVNFECDGYVMSFELLIWLEIITSCDAI